MEPREVREQDLASYQQFAQAAAAQESASEAFLNRHVEHAWVIIDLLFRKADRRVEILTGGLNPAIYGDARVVESAIAFLDRSWAPSPAEQNLVILLEKDTDCADHPLISRARAYREQIEIRRVPETMRDTYPFHFVIADSKHYRCKKLRGLPEAVVQFNAPETAETLHQLFAQIRDQSRIIPLDG